MSLTSTTTTTKAAPKPLTSPHDVPTTLNYCVPHGPIPLISYVWDPPPGVPKTNFDIVPHPTVIHDVRNTSLEHESSLDIHAFQYLRSPARETSFDDTDSFENGYYKEIEELILKTVPGSKKVVIFDRTVRRLVNEPADRDEGRGPLHRVHVDQTPESARKRVCEQLPPDQANRLLNSGTRIRIINVWRPMGNPVAHSPLAVCDYRSLHPANDLIPTRKMRKEGQKEGGTYNVRFSSSHRWHYLRDMTPEECLLIKCSDTDESKAQMCPHTAFSDLSSPKDAPHRQSIEVRCLVFDSI